MSVLLLRMRGIIRQELLRLRFEVLLHSLRYAVWRAKLPRLLGIVIVLLLFLSMQVSQVGSWHAIMRLLHSQV